MAASVMCYFEDLLDNALPKPSIPYDASAEWGNAPTPEHTFKTLREKFATCQRRDEKTHISSVSAEPLVRKAVICSSTIVTQPMAISQKVDLPTQCTQPSTLVYEIDHKTHPPLSPPPYDTLLPDYDQVSADLPPDYTSTDQLSTRAQFLQHSQVTKQDTRIECSPPALSPWRSHNHIDWSQVDNIRSHVSKKAKKASQAAQQAKWADSGDEDDGAKKDGAEENGSNNAGAGGDGGDAGAGAGAGDDDDDDEWATGLSKKDKKKKKSKKQQEDEEEEERKKKEDEAAAAVSGSFWDDEPVPAADANAEDEWGTTSASKKKKGKKGKVSAQFLNIIEYAA